MGGSLRYYNQHVRKFLGSTRGVELTQIQDRFLGYLKPETRILDFGCGSGRGAKYFISREYMADAADDSVKLVKIISEYTGINVRQMLFQDLDEREAYEGIWACSSILHLIFDELMDMFEKIHRALVPCGVLYISFKYGTGEGERNGEYFTNMIEEKMEGLLKTIYGFATSEMWVMFDVCSGRSEGQWLNMILRKRQKRQMGNVIEYRTMDYYRKGYERKNP